MSTITGYFGFLPIALILTSILILFISVSKIQLIRK